MRVGCGCRYEYEGQTEVEGGPSDNRVLAMVVMPKKTVAIGAMGSEKQSKEVLKEGQVPDQH